MRRMILPLASAVVVLSLAACGGGTQDVERTPAAAGEAAHGHYQGPWVSFDYPDGWHEFNWHYWGRWAAYGPVSGGNDDFVGIGLAPRHDTGTKPEDILTLAVPMNQQAGPVERVGVNGVPGYTVPTAPTVAGQVLEGEATLIQGERDYVAVCQYGEPAKEQVLTGCEMLKDTFVEKPPPPATDPSGCTDAALELLRSLPMPQGVLPSEELETIPLERKGIEYLACDLMVYRADLAYEHGEDLIAYFRSRLTEAGWRVRTTLAQVFATRDFDSYYIEVYFAGDQPDYFFVTAYDG